MCSRFSARREVERQRYCADRRPRPAGAWPRAVRCRHLDGHGCWRILAAAPTGRGLRVPGVRAVSASDGARQRHDRTRASSATGAAGEGSGTPGCGAPWRTRFETTSRIVRRRAAARRARQSTGSRAGRAAARRAVRCRRSCRPEAPAERDRQLTPDPARAADSCDSRL